MSFEETPCWRAFSARDDLAVFGDNALMLFALQMRFRIEDISIAANNSLTDGSDDKKVDLVHIDSEEGYAVIAQAYLSRTERPSAPANKASDLNAAMSWLLSTPEQDLPDRIRSHAIELRSAIADGLITTLHIWYVHNLPESDNVQSELRRVESTASGFIDSHFDRDHDIDIQALEVGISILSDWYEAIVTPILVGDEYLIRIRDGYEIAEANWNAYVTAIPAKFLYDLFNTHKTKLFSANVRDYLGSRKTDRNINHGIKDTVDKHPQHFWVYNNGITALVNGYQIENDDQGQKLRIRGISIVNGAQTAGAIGSLCNPPGPDAMVQVRFITCTDQSTIHSIVRFNNYQNSLEASDFRSRDSVQTRINREFASIPAIEYLPRRGGHEDLIHRRPNTLRSVVAGQALAAFHKGPEIAYHEKNKIWEDNSLYEKYFNDQTTARHILFAYSLLMAVSNKKQDLLSKSKVNGLIEVEKEQLEFYRLRGSAFLIASAVARCLETLLGRPIPNYFTLKFRKNLTLEEGTQSWAPIVESLTAFTAPLRQGLADGFKKVEAVEKAVKEFQSLVEATKGPNRPVFSEFTGRVG